jgi:hypothetical protein
MGTVAMGELPRTAIKIGTARIEFTTWRELIRLSTMRHVLADGFHRHISTNEFLRHLLAIVKDIDPMLSPMQSQVVQHAPVGKDKAQMLNRTLQDKARSDYKKANRTVKNRLKFANEDDDS